MQNNVLDQEWDTAGLLRFAFPTVIMMLFMGLYTIVDTIFVARMAGTDALSAINVVCPVVNITVGLGTMFAAGGNAVISRKMGMGQKQEAKEDFTVLVMTAAVTGGIILAAGTIWMDRIVYVLGASDLLFPYCKEYLGVLLLFLPANMLQTVYSNLFVTAGRPGLGFGLSVLAGLANILLDYVFMVLCGLGIRGAALGTGCGYCIVAVTGTVFFLRSKGSLSFAGFGWKWKVIKESMLNGSSEMVGQMAAAVTTFLFNITIMALAGEDGVAAVTIMIYSQFLLNTLYIGFSMGVAPVIGFNYGNQSSIRQKKVFRICMRFIMASSLPAFGFSMLGGAWVAGIFVPAASPVYRIAAEGFSVFSWSFLFCGLNIFTSAMFTALSEGMVSAVLSFFRTFGLLAGGILLLPHFFGITGVFLAVPAAEGIMFFISVLCLIHYRKRYLYW